MDAPADNEALLNAASPAGVNDAAAAPEAAEGQRRERRPRNDNRRRNEGADAAAPQGLIEAASMRAEQDAQGASGEPAPAEGDADNAGQRAPRERRSRDRYGRDRRERAPRDASAGEADTGSTEAPTPAAEAQERTYEAPARSYFSMPVPAATPDAPAAAAPVAAPAVEPVPVLDAAPAPRARAVAPAPKAIPSAPARQGLPLVQPYTVSIDELNQVAQASGLEWVNSDATKVAQVQAAIAAEPKPIHVPREIKPVVLVDEGPLVLVETRKDLRNMPLPFEAQ